MTRHVGSLFLLVTLMGLGGCDNQNEKRKVDLPTPPTAEQIAECEKVMKLKLPKSATPIALDKTTQGSEVLYTFKVEMPAADVEAFLKTTLFRSKPLASDDRCVQSGSATRTWWDPETVEKFRAARHTIRPGFEEQSLMIDESKGDRAFVYIMHSTSQ
ncbi:MAG: hypothetical protein HRU75_11105 [Planctomycetia bacterium]|nr:MAG: hypothetical protein HRU75_11105 [Planctomycetia bacterium]